MIRADIPLSSRITSKAGAGTGGRSPWQGPGPARPLGGGARALRGGKTSPVAAGAPPRVSVGCCGWEPCHGAGRAPPAADAGARGGSWRGKGAQLRSPRARRPRRSPPPPAAGHGPHAARDRCCPLPPGAAGSPLPPLGLRHRSVPGSPWRLLGRALPACPKHRTPFPRSGQSLSLLGAQKRLGGVLPRPGARTRLLGHLHICALCFPLLLQGPSQKLCFCSVPQLLLHPKSWKPMGREHGGKPPPVRARLAWVGVWRALRAKDCGRFWAQQKRGKTALFKPLMKCHLQFPSMAVTWRIRSTPGSHRLTRGVLLWRGFGKGGTGTKASKHDCPFPRARGLCLPRVL